MPSTLTTLANERSTYVITAAFTDAAGDAVVPNSITWTLTDEAWRVINSRSAVAVAVPAASISIVLSGADLALHDAKDSGGRVLTVEAEYDSTEGSGLPLNDEVRFRIAPLGKVS
jgi:hypothetical protein